MREEEDDMLQTGRRRASEVISSIVVGIIGIGLFVGITLFMTTYGQKAIDGMTADVVDRVGLAYAEEIVAKCPQAADAARAALADGRVGADEVGVLDTRVELVRAERGGLAACPVEPRHLDRSSGWTILPS
jgi:hypothetical protein